MGTIFPGPDIRFYPTSIHHAMVPGDSLCPPSYAPPTREEFEALRREVLEIKELLKRDDAGFTHDQVIGGRA